MLARTYPRVLLVDDDASDAAVLARMLREDGYQVELEADGERAIARLHRGPDPDVLIVDYRLPCADGLAVAAVARRRSTTLHIVMVTSYPELVVSRTTDPTVVTLGKPLGYADLMRELERGASARTALAAG